MGEGEKGGGGGGGGGRANILIKKRNTLTGITRYGTPSVMKALVRLTCGLR